MVRAGKSLRHSYGDLVIMDADLSDGRYGHWLCDIAMKPTDVAVRIKAAVTMI